MAKLETQINQIFLSPAESNKVSLILFEEKISAGNHLYLIAELRKIQKKTELNDLSKIADLIISSFKTKRKVSGEILFENALADINNHLAEFAHKGRKSWLGKFSALVALKSEREFFASNTGYTAAWLRRKNSLNEILSPEKSTVQPLKTFTNFSSGKLIADDNLVLCTSSLFNYVSVELFSKMLNGYDLQEACQRISDILQSTAKADEGFAVFMLNMAKQVNEAPEQSPPPVINPQPELEQLAEPEAIIEQPVSTPPKSNSKKRRSNKSFEAVTAPSVESIAIASSAVSKNPAVTNTEPLTNIYAPLPEDIRKERTNTPRSLLSGVPSFKALPSWSALKALPAAVTRIPLPKFNIPQINWPRIPIWSNMSGPAKFFFGSFVVFAILFGMNIAAYSVRKAQAEHEAKFNQSAQALVDYLSEAESALIYKNQSQAMKFISDAATELHKIEQLDISKAGPFQEKFDDMNNKINRVTILRNLTPVSEISYPITLMERAGNGYIVASSNQNSLGMINNDELAPIFMLNQVDGEIRGVTHASSAGNFVASRDKIYLVNQTAQEYQMVHYVSNGDLVSLKFTDPNRLYTINRTTNQVIRMNVAANGVSDVQNVLTANSNLQTARDLAADSDIYVLFPDKVQKFTNGQLTDFTLSPVSEPLSQLTKIRLGNQIYLLEPVAKRVLIYSRTGELLNQVQFPELTELKDIYVDESTREIIMINGAKIFRITF